LRSDTVTKPSRGMREAMYRAEVGDNFYREDKTTQELEEYCAWYFNKEAAAFLLTGTMANQVALRTYIQPGNEVILDSSYHINYYEYSATASLCGAALNLLNTPDGIINESELYQAINGRHRSNLTGIPALLCLENSINYHSGKIFPIDVFAQVTSLSKKYKIPVYLDGARLLNACATLNKEPKEYSDYADSLMISFSKGLGAPAGAVLLGSQGFIEEARKYQKWYGGGMHQSGILAAAALYAIKKNVEKLNEDNKKAIYFANLLSSDARIKIDFSKIETNIVMFSFDKPLGDIANFINLARSHGILLYEWDQHTIRAVTHKDINDKQIETAASRILKLIPELYNNIPQGRLRVVHG